MMKCWHHSVVLEISFYCATHYKLKNNINVTSLFTAVTYLLVIDSFTRDNIFMFAGRVVLVVDLPLPHGDVAEAAAPQGHPAARAVLPHHHLGPHPHQVLTTETERSEVRGRPRVVVIVISISTVQDSFIAAPPPSGN